MILEVPQVKRKLAVTATAVGRVWEIIQRSPFLTSCKLLMSRLRPENQIQKVYISTFFTKHSPQCPLHHSHADSKVID